MDENDLLHTLLTELRRGSLTLAVLGSLKQPRYGYALLQELKQGELEIEANTLYPLLRRLENQGLLTSAWQESTFRPRKYYSISESGNDFLETLLLEWRKLHENIEFICGGAKSSHGLYEFD